MNRGESQMSRTHSGSAADAGVDDTTPFKLGLLEHLRALDNFSNPTQLLSSHFLFSLTTQKPPNPQAGMATSSMAFPIQHIQRLESAQVQKAWHALSNLKVSSRNYARPGKTVEVKNASAEFDHDVGRTAVASSWCINKNAGISLSGKSQFTESLVIKSHSQMSGGSFSNNIVHTSQLKECLNKLVNEMDGDDDDDGILENIDVDHIVEQYQSSCTPKPSISKLPPLTPSIHTERQEATCLPPELCTNCVHGFMIGVCPEAANHLQELKDRLITISNELLDDVNELSPEQIEKLRQDRLFEECFQRRWYRTAACYILVIAKLEGPAVSQYCALRLLQATLDESLYELAGELVRFLLRSGREYEQASTDTDRQGPSSPRFLGYFGFRSCNRKQSLDKSSSFKEQSAHVASVKNILESHASYLMLGKELSKLVAFVKGTQFDLVEYLQRERFGCARLENFTSGLELIGQKLQMSILQSRFDAEFLLAHMCSVKFKEWIVVLATLLRRSEVLFDLFQDDMRLWKAYSFTLQSHPAFTEYHDLLGDLEDQLSSIGTSEER